MPPTIACIGAAHLDRKAHALGPVVQGTSNPVRMETGFGGVARNVAETLARLGARARMVSRLGQDSGGDAVLSQLQELGIDTGPITRAEGQATASYTALLDPDGSLSVAMADMAIYDGFSSDELSAARPSLSGCDAWFVDANLPDSALDALLSQPHPDLVAMDCVSVAKSARLAGVIDRLDVVFANGDELAALSGHPVRAPLDIATAAHALRHRGVGAVVVARGAEGCYAVNDAMESFFPALDARVVDVTGAGDALVAGTLFGLTDGRGLANAIQLGIACATLTVESAHTVPPDLTPTAAMARAEIA